MYSHVRDSISYVLCDQALIVRLLTTFVKLEQFPLLFSIFYYGILTENVSNEFQHCLGCLCLYIRMRMQNLYTLTALILALLTVNSLSQEDQKLKAM